MAQANRDYQGSHADPRDRPMASWRGRIAVMASRGETTGPRVEEARRALGWWRCHNAIAAEVERGTIPADQADQLIEQLTGVMA